MKRATGSISYSGETMANVGSASDLSSLLTESCVRRSPALVVATDSALARPARFLELTDEGIVLELLSAAAPQRQRWFALYLITFNHDGRGRAFFGHILDRDDDHPHSARLTLSHPDHILTVESRLAFRFPVGDHGLAAAIAWADQSYTGTPLNISLAGMLLECRAEDGAPSVGEVVRVTLRHGKDEISLLAEVRHHQGDSYGLFFVEYVQQGQVHAPEPLRRLVTTLERHWLRARAV